MSKITNANTTPKAPTEAAPAQTAPIRQAALTALTEAAPTARLNTASNDQNSMRTPPTTPLEASHPENAEPGDKQPINTQPTNVAQDARTEACERAAEKLSAWVESCPSDSEKRNWEAVANQMQAQGVYLDDSGRYVIEGDLFANDFHGLVAPHTPLSLPDDLTVTGTLDLSFFSGLNELPRGLVVGERLMLTTVQDILARTPHPVTENGRIINGDHVPS